MKKWVIAFLLGIGVPFACNLSYVRLEFPKDILNGDWDALTVFKIHPCIRCVHLTFVHGGFWVSKEWTLFPPF